MFSLNENEVHLWQADISKIALDATSTSLLSHDEQCSVNKKKNGVLQQNYIKSRVFLRRILALYVKQQPDLIQFYFNEHKKPFVLENEKNVFFNLSHTKDKIVCAVTHAFQVGVDVECIERTVAFAVAEHYFHSEERDYLNQLALTEKCLGFFNIWTRKEAVLKALGVGLSFPMQAFSVLPLSRIQRVVNGRAIDLQTCARDAQNIIGLAALQPVDKLVSYDYHRIFENYSLVT